MGRVRVSPPDLSAVVAAIVNALVLTLVPLVAAEIRTGADADADPWLDHTRWPMSRRRARELAAAGRIPAVKRGRFWYARRSAIDVFIAAGRPAPAPVPANDPGPCDGAAADDDVDAVLRRAGFERPGTVRVRGSRR
jgi:hypothetical protein